jgi:hypothetical protein
VIGVGEGYTQNKKGKRFEKIYFLTIYDAFYVI